MKIYGLGYLTSGFAARIANVLSRVLSALGRHRGAYYINGAGTLPPPLTADEEARIIAGLGNEADAYLLRQTLIEHNLRLVVYTAKKFGSSGNGIEDLISIGTIGLIKAVNTFKADKNIKLATYASRCIENEILMYLRRQNGRHEIPLDEPLNTDADGNELILADVLSTDDDTSASLEKSEERKTIRQAISTLNERDQAIVSMRFGLSGGRELTQKEVADRMGISQSYISRLEKKILSRLGEMLEGKV